MMTGFGAMRKKKEAARGRLLLRSIGRGDRDADPEALTRVVGQAGVGDLAPITGLDVVAHDAALFGHGTHVAAGGLRAGIGAIRTTGGGIADGAPGNRAGRGGSLAAVTLADGVAQDATDHGT